MSTDRAPVPWSFNEARVIFAAGAIGAAMLVASWWAASGTAKPESLNTWVMVGVASLGVVSGASLLWLLAGRRAIRARRDELLTRIERGVETQPPSIAPDRPVASSLVAVRSSERYHRSDCMLVRGKDVQRLTGTARSLGRRKPCEMCRP